MKKIILTAIMSMGVLFYGLDAMAAAIKEGEWSMTTTIHMDGMDEQAAEAMQEMENMSPEEKAMMERMMGGMKMGPGANGMGMSTTVSQCLTNDNPVPEAPGQEDCTQTHSVDGNTVSFETICPDSHSTGQVTYSNKSMNGTIQSTTMEDGVEKTMTIDINGEYVGPCETEDEASAEDEGLSQKALAIREKELELKARELELQEKAMEMEAEASAPKKSKKSAMESVSNTVNATNNAVNTTNNVKNTFGGLRSLMGN